MKLYGKNSITERLRTNTKSIKRIFFEKEIDVLDVEKICKACGIPVEHLSKNEFQKKSQGIRSQGVIAEVEDFKYAYLEDILVNRATRRVAPTILFMDNLNDPQNLGSILRTSACLGGFSVVLPRHDSVEVTEAALRVAQGGENYVPVAKAVNLALAIEKAKKAGYWIAGAVLEAGEDLKKSKLNFPLGIVIGSEGKGIRPGLMKILDIRLSLPMGGAKLSFNAAVAAALFCYEVARQRTSLRGAPEISGSLAMTESKDD